MADADKGGPRTNAKEREVPVDWEALEDAFENNAPEVHSYLQLTTGEVLRVVDGIADPEMHARIASDADYMRVDPVSSREQYRWMERFIPMVEETELRERLAAAIDGKGAFRRFKDVLMAYGPERERWFAFRSERLRVFMEAWLSAHALRAVPRQAWPTEEEAHAKESPISQAELTGRRGRGADALRKLLRELGDNLGARDLEKVVAFAEFVKARRAARTFAHRHEAASGEAPPESGQSDHSEPPDPADAEDFSSSGRTGNTPQ